MTPKIKELAERAGFDVKESAYHINHFAESLIHECINEINKRAADPYYKNYALKLLIRVE